MSYKYKIEKGTGEPCISPALPAILVMATIVKATNP